MSTGYQIKEQGELYYLTFQVVDWVDLSTRPEKIDTTHQNQVDTLLVQNPEDDLYSSARYDAGLSVVLEVELRSFPWKTVR